MGRLRKDNHVYNAYQLRSTQWPEWVNHQPANELGEVIVQILPLAAAIAAAKVKKLCDEVAALLDRLNVLTQVQYVSLYWMIS